MGTAIVAAACYLFISMSLFSFCKNALAVNLKIGVEYGSLEQVEGASLKERKPKTSTYMSFPLPTSNASLSQIMHFGISFI